MTVRKLPLFDGFIDYVDTLAHHQDLNFVVRSLVLRIPYSVISSQLHQSRFQALSFHVSASQERGRCRP